MAGDFVLSSVEGLTRAEVTSLIDSPLLLETVSLVGERKAKAESHAEEINAFVLLNLFN